MQPVVLPRRPVPGDKVAIISPSSPADPAQVAEGMRVLRAFGLQPYVAGRPSSPGTMTPAPIVGRIAEIVTAAQDPSVGLILASTGGIGASELLPLLPMNSLLSARKAIMGFSDTTALLLGVNAATGLITFCGPSATVRVDDAEVTALDYEALGDAVRLLMSKPGDWGSAPFQRADAPPVVVQPGRASGACIGGNLTVFASLLASPWMPLVDGAILFLEDVNVGAYEFRRFIGQLATGGIFGRVAGVVFGDFAGENPAPGEPTIADVIDESFAGASFPCLRGLNFSHGRTIATLPIGALCQVDDQLPRGVWFEDPLAD